MNGVGKSFIELPDAAEMLRRYHFSIQVNHAKFCGNTTISRHRQTVFIERRNRDKFWFNNNVSIFINDACFVIFTHNLFNSRYSKHIKIIGLP